MGKKLYCGNLSYDVSSSDLEQLFSQFGTVVSAQVVEDRDSGRSKGFGFVEMSSDEEAQAAISGLDGTDQLADEIRFRRRCGKGCGDGHDGGILRSD